MKLAKLSLAAIIAAGAFSVANATPLEDAIKGVDLSGMLRIRYYNRTWDQSDTYNRWRTNGIFIFKVPVGDNLKMVYRSSVQSDVRVDDDTAINNAAAQVDPSATNNLLFMAYSNGPLNVIGGKIPVPTSVTSADPVTPGHGAGVIASYNVGNGFTVAGAFVDALKDGGGEGAAVGLPDTLPNTIYAAAIMYKNDMVKANAWYYTATNVVDYIFTLTADVTPIAGLKLHGDYAVGELDSDFAPNEEDSNYFNLNASYTINGFTGMIGYAATDDTSAGSTRSPVELAIDAPIGASLPTANRYNIAYMDDTDAWYGKLAYNVDAKTNVYAAYTSIDQGQTAGDNDSDEYIVGAKYKYNKKLGFHVYYDVLDFDKSFPAANDENEFRVEARYNF